MISRRHFVQAGMAAAAITGSAGGWSRLAAQQALTQDDLLAFETFGNVSLIHLTDIHAQTVPIWFREPAINLGVGEAAGLPPHLTGAEMRAAFGIEAGSAMRVWQGAGLFTLQTSSFTLQWYHTYGGNR
jgi:sulfur-oxidizing protein SoxB